MKTLSLLVLLFTLTSCAAANRVSQGTSILFPARYDTNEYELINWIRTTAELSINSCQDTEISRTNFDTLHASALEFKNLTEYLPRNQNVNDLATNLYLLVDNGSSMYNNEEVSTFFCQNTLLQIIDSSINIQQVTGRKRK